MFLFRPNKRHPQSVTPTHPWPLDRPLLHLSKRDAWTIGDACEGCQILGTIGAGKTSGSGQAIAKSFLRAGLGGLVLTAKPDECEMWQRHAAETGRTDDLIIVRPNGEHRINFLDYEYSRPGDGAAITESIVGLFCAGCEATSRGGGNGGTNDRFWQSALKQLLRNAVDLLAIAKDRVTLPELARIIATAPNSLDNLEDPQWQSRSFCMECLLEAHARADACQLTPSRRADFQATADYWCGEFPNMDGRTRSNVVATFTTMADPLTRGPLRDLFGTDTTFTPEDSQRGKIIILDFPVKEFNEAGQLIQVLIKHLWQRAIERRDIRDNPLPVFLWCDEAHYFVTRHDMEFQTTARSVRACTVYLTQNLSNYYASLGAGGEGGAAKAAADSLLACLRTKVFHANGDPVTNRWAEDLVGRKWDLRTSVSRSESGAKDQRPKQFKPNVTLSDSLEPELLAREFTLLRSGGPQHGFVVEGIVVQSGRVWAINNKTFLKVAFLQR